MSATSVAVHDFAEGAASCPRAVVLPSRLGLPALRRMSAAGMQVGPAVVCAWCRTVHIPVPVEAAENPVTRRLTFTETLECAGSDGPCPGRGWQAPLLSRSSSASALTDHAGLADQVQRVRALRARGVVPP